MTLALPNYLKTSNVQDDSLRYEWDDWKTLPALKDPDQETVLSLKSVSHRAIFAVSCGIGEWIVHRFAKLCDDSAPWDYLEAAWAMLVDVRYSGYGSATGWQEYAARGWDGPVKRPIRNALRFLDIEFEQVSLDFGTDPAVYAGYMSALTLHVMTDPTAYRRWLQQILPRFSTLYPRDRHDPLGDVVPRQAVDPEFPFNVEETEALVNAYLAKLDHRTNIFLSSPDGMVEHFEGEPDFVGIPYRFDIELDRRARRTRNVTQGDDGD